MAAMNVDQILLTAPKLASLAEVLMCESPVRAHAIKAAQLQARALASKIFDPMQCHLTEIEQ